MRRALAPWGRRLLWAGLALAVLVAVAAAAVLWWTREPEGGAF